MKKRTTNNAETLVGAIVRTIGGSRQAWKVRTVEQNGVDFGGRPLFDFRGDYGLATGERLPACALTCYPEDLEIVKPAPEKAPAPGQHVAEVCLYGNGAADCGYGFLGEALNGERFGDGEPRPSWSMTCCLMRARATLNRLGYVDGFGYLYAPAGDRRARFQLSGKLEMVGELKWEPAPVLVLDADQVQAAAGDE